MGKPASPIGPASGAAAAVGAAEVTAIAELAAAVGLSDCYVSRLLRLAWLSPDVLERLVVRREPYATSLYDLCFVASLPWDEQPGRVFD